MNKFTFRGLIKVVNIKDNSNKDFAIENISKDIFIKGPNLWYLASSAILASIGLDTNSPAVIIGAMLISPLMSPILGIGLGIGIYDKELFFSSIKEFAVAVFLSLLISFLYFVLSPLGNITNELLARTTPTILDIGIAFFGGVAGIVAASRKGVVNSIPGVAIATALMPPLCTAGFGLAKGTPAIFFGASYLFFINAVFISLSAFVIVRYLKFPYKSYLDSFTKSKIKRIILFVIVLVSIPSLVIFYKIIKNANEQKQLKSFISQNFEVNNRNVISWKLQKYDSSQTLSVFYIGEKIKPQKEDSLKIQLNDKFGKIDLNVQQLDQDNKIANLEKKLTSDVDDKFQSLFSTNAALEDKIKKLEQEYKFDITDSVKLSKFNVELGVLFQFFKKIDVSKDSLLNVNVITDLKGRNAFKERKRLEDYIRYKIGDSAIITIK